MSNFKIKSEYVGTTVKVYDRILGTRTIVVDKIDMAKVKYYQSIGLKHIFEEIPEVTVIEYKAVEGPIPAPKKKRKPKKFTERLAEVKKEQESINTSVDTDAKA